MAQQEEKNQSPWVPLASNPAKYFPKPVRWIDSSGKEHIFVCADYDDPTIKSKVQAYNVDQNKWIPIADYPKDAKPQKFTMSINEQNNLYIYGGTRAVFMIFNLVTQKFTVICKNGQNDEREIAKKHNIQKTGWYPASIFIENISSFNVFCGVANKKHTIWNESSKQMLESYEFPQSVNGGLFGHAAIFIPNQSKALILGGIKDFMIYSDTILCCEITKKKNHLTDMIWKEYAVALPVALCYFGCICVQDRFLMIFGGEKQGAVESEDIWCLDTMNIQKGWLRSNVKCPSKGRFHAVEVNGNKVHLFAMGDNGHWLQDIDHILPFQKDKSDNRNLLKLGYRKSVLELSQLDDDNNEDLREKVNTLEHKLAELSDLYVTLQDDYKNLQNEYGRQAAELKQFREKYGYDEGNFETWNADKIVDWIKNLEFPRFAKYELVLRKNMKSENVDGGVLGALDRTDWTRFGINDIKDKITLQKYIDKLVGNNKAAKANQDDDDMDEYQQEGGGATGVH